MIKKIKANPHKTHFLLYFIAEGIFGMLISVPGPVIPFLAHKYSLPETSFAFMYWTRATGFILGGFLTKIIAKYFRYHRLMFISSIMIGLLFATFPFTNSIPLQGLEILLAHIFTSIFEIIIFMCFLEAFKGNEVEYWHQLSFVFFSICALLCQILVGFIGEMSYLVIGVACITLSIAFCFVKTPESIDHGTTEGKQQSGEKNEGYERSEGEEGHQKINLRSEVALALMTFCYFAEETGFSGWISSYSNMMGAFNIEQSAFLVSLFWGAMTIFRFIYANFKQTIYQKLLLLFCLRALAFSVAIALSLMGFLKASVIMGCLLTGIAYSSSYSLIYNLPLHFNQKLIPSQAAHLTMCGTLGSGILSSLQGFLMKIIGPGIFFPYLAGIGFLNYCLLKRANYEMGAKSTRLLAEVELAEIK